MTRDLLKKNFPELAEEGALEITIIKVGFHVVHASHSGSLPDKQPSEKSELKEPREHIRSSRGSVARFSLRISCMRITPFKEVHDLDPARFSLSKFCPSARGKAPYCFLCKPQWWFSPKT